MKKKYKISLDGCDDSTYIKIELTDTQYKLIKKIADESEKASSYGCEPTMTIEEIN